MNLNFNQIKKQYLNLTLTNGKTIMIGTPKKKLLDQILVVYNKIDVNTKEISEELINQLYMICADIMSTNKTNTKINPKELEELLDIEDIILFFNTYMNYLNSITNSKN